MKSGFLTALGCLLWLIFLAAGIRELFHHGLYARGEVDAGIVALLAVPLAMMAGTVALGLRSARADVPGRVFVASTLVAALGFLLCLGALARGA
ncbi:MAG TPA: hypothetical protein VN029_11700 [Sphingomonas sp.]|nr:hypothetical protein [Sphingomonas sp.]